MVSASICCLAISVAASASLFLYWRAESLRHRRLLNGIWLRIHVNGIRGKSSVTRLIAGVLREAGIRTLAKTTGTAAVVILPDATERPIVRRAAPSILEQIRLLSRYADQSIEAIVIECMAVRPSYQAICEEHLIRADLGVITNVREDHQEEMGSTLPDIARSLLRTCPREGVLITAEPAAELQEIMYGEAARRGTRLVVADPDEVPNEFIRQFSYVEFKENVAIGLAVAAEIGIDRETALRGMRSAQPDPGAMRVLELRVGGKRVTWANMFAMNDRQSVLMVTQTLAARCGPESMKVAVLNNRTDRSDRALSFADIAALDLHFDRVALIGAYEQAVGRRMIEQGFPSKQIIRLGEHRGPSIDEMIERMTTDLPTEHVMLFGMVNIHTRQADMLVDYLEQRSEANEFAASDPTCGAEEVAL